MDQDKQAARSEKKFLFRKALLFYVILVLAAIIGTLAWLVMNSGIFEDNSTPGNIHVKVSTENLRVALDADSIGGDTLIIKRDAPLETLNVTGNGQQLLASKTDTISETSGFDDVTGDTSYHIELRIFFKTASKMEIFLAKDSYVSGVENPTQDEYARQSQFGDFSRDAIAGAVRVAFLSSDGVDGSGKEILTLRSVWVPNDYYYLHYDGETALFAIDDEYRESKTGYRYYYLDENGHVQQYEYTEDDYANGVLSVRADQMAGRGMINQSVPLLSFENDETAQAKELVIRIWVEGTDREADEALKGGMLKYVFSFVGINKEESDITLASESEISGGLAPSGKLGVYFNTSSRRLCYCDFSSRYNRADASPIPDNTLYYSADGIIWHPYNESCCLGINADLVQKEETYTIYIRTMESHFEKSGNIVTITIPKLKQ